MTKLQKRLEKMRHNPKDCRIEDLEDVAKHYDVNLRKSGGSHVIFDHPNRPIKPIYVKRFLLLIDTLEE